MANGPISTPDCGGKTPSGDRLATWMDGLPRRAAEDVVRWIARGGSGPPPDVATDSTHAGRLMYFAKAHRILGRLAQACARAAGPVSSELRRLVDQEWLEYEGRELNRMKQAKALLHPLLEPDGMLLKGWTLYAHTADRFRLRDMLDVDLLAQQPELLVERVKLSGGVDGKPPAPHELARLRLEGLYLEVHRYVPYARCPIRARDCIGLPIAPGRIHQTSEATHQVNVDTRSLLAEAHETTAPCLEGLRFPSATAAALVACLSFATDLWWEPFSSKSRRVAMLLELHDLCELPGFCADQFTGMVARYGAEPAATLCAQALDLLSPTNPLHHWLSRSIEQPQKTMGGSRGVWVRREVGSMLFDTTNDFIRSLCPTPVGNAGHSKPARYAVNGGAIDDARAVLSWSEGPLPPDVVFEVHGGSEIRVDVHVRSPPIGTMNLFFHLCGSGFVDSVRWSDRTMADFGAGSVTWEEASGHTRASAVLDVEQELQDAHAMVAVSGEHPDGSEWSVAVPLVFTR